ncbi:hypothetical protein SBA4_2790006 [Candidatus Sulfopaludibacter sp. SbA4]|nr:hypothetical protein SBA4_2790006 [Candidatus Sulfopaludibacter sp. SbA4]
MLHYPILFERSRRNRSHLRPNLPNRNGTCAAINPPFTSEKLRGRTVDPTAERDKRSGTPSFPSEPRRPRARSGRGARGQAAVMDDISFVNHRSTRVPDSEVVR